MLESYLIKLYIDLYHTVGDENVNNKVGRRIQIGLLSFIFKCFFIYIIYQCPGSVAWQLFIFFIQVFDTC